MILVNVTGGFANQLFRFAAGYQFCKKFNKRMIIICVDKECYIDAYLLDSIDIPDYTKIIVKVDKNEDIIKRELGLDNLIVVNEQNYFEYYNSESLNKFNYYINAPFNKKVYFEDVYNDIVKMFSLRDLQGFLYDFKEKVQSENSVGVHVRRTDFVYLNEAEHGAYDEDYYKAAISAMRKKIVTPIFYIFSDDIDWCKDFFGEGNDLSYVKIIGGKFADIEEFFCLSWCRHRILTRGSTYSKMADFLNQNNDSITVYKGNEPDRTDIIYIDNEKVRSESYVFNKTYISRTDESVDDKNEKKQLYYQKARDIGSVSTKDAQLTMARGWEYGYSDISYLNQYTKILLKNKNYYDAAVIIAAIHRLSGNINKYIDEIPLEYIDLVRNLTTTDVDTIIVMPEEPYLNAQFNDLTNVGIILQRAGFNVNYIFKRLKRKHLYNNAILENNYMYTDCEGYRYQSRMYIRDIIENQYDINEFINDLCKNKKAILIAESPDVIDKKYSDNIYKVLWNARTTWRAYDKPRLDIKKGTSADVIVSNDSLGKVYENKNIVIPDMKWCYKTYDRLSIYDQYKYHHELYDVINKILTEAHARNY